ncbi:MAG: hypothetical protein J5692_04320 [Bacteroidales bacterium]|nr:hypothetical protein [Bacteroidales bacterium]
MKVLLLIILSLLADPIPSGKAFLEQLQKRDSILIADQVEYGFTLEGVAAGTALALPDWSSLSNDTLTIVRDWKTDTLRFDKKAHKRDIRASIVLAPFEEGEYILPPIYALRGTPGSEPDTLVFEPVTMKVTTIQIDTATFTPHDIKGQITYPVTFAEVVPWVLGAIGLAALVMLAIWLIRRYSRRGEDSKPKDPPYVVALRSLDRWRGEKFWAPDKQKSFYSGVTDTLKEYIDAEFGVDAPEMTTADLFEALKGREDITPEMFERLKKLFETADFVKFAKLTLPPEDNAGVLPTAVSFVTETYQKQLQGEEALEK